MKKYIIALLISLALIIPSANAAELPKKTKHEKVKINLFWASWCSNCHNLINYFNDIYKDYEDYFEFVTYQIDGDEANTNLANIMLDELNIDKKLSIPFVIIGTDYYNFGFGGKTTADKMIEQALTEYQNSKYVDIVSKVVKNKKLKPNKKSFSDAYKAALETANQNAETNNNNNSNITNNQVSNTSNQTLVVASIFGVLVVAFVVLVVISRKD